MKVDIKFALVLCALVFFNCESRKSVQEQKPTIVENEVLRFVNKKKHRFSRKKQDIPIEIKDSLQNYYTMGDSSDIEKISFSDARLSYADGKPMYPYDSKLNYVLFDIDACLISYTKGGIGKYDVIEYFDLGKKYNHVKYETSEIIEDTLSLKVFLSLKN